MKHCTFAVAGHVDHGKTALTRALTGVDTDRLPEERRRGLTIQPGFAALQLDHALVGLVDDPGHEKFLPNLLSASGGVDALLLVVDAGEGPKPQTWEHLEVLTQLGAARGVAILTKTDLLPPDEVARRADALHTALRGTILENAPILPVSAHTGAGLAELRAALDALALACPARKTERPFRLPVDRVFAADGFGAVVTGTVWEGAVRPGDLVQLYPGDRTARVRAVQRHGEAVPFARAGERAALNLAGVEVGALARGMTAASPGSLTLTRRLDCAVTVWAKSPGPLAPGTALRLHHGSGSAVGRAYPLTGETLKPGETGLVQLRLDTEAALRPLDRFVLRLLSPAATLGGGQVLDPSGCRRKKDALPRLERLRAGGYPALAEQTLRQAEGPLSPGALALSLGLSVPETAELLSSLDTAKPLENEFIHIDVLNDLREQVTAALADFHAAHPLSPGMGREELRQTAPDGVVRTLAEEGVLILNGPTAALPDFAPSWPSQLLPVRDKLLAKYEHFGLTPPDNAGVEALFGRDAALARQAGRRLEEEGRLIPYAPRRRMGREAYDRALALLTDLFAQRNELTLAQFRDAAGISRDFALLLLEHWDKLGLTRRVGNVRILVKK